MDKLRIQELVPNRYAMKHVTRYEKRHGGSVALIYKTGISLRLLASSSDLDTNELEVQLAVVYGPPPSKVSGLRYSVFLQEEKPVFLAMYATIAKAKIMAGDLNFHLDTD